VKLQQQHRAVDERPEFRNAKAAAQVTSGAAHARCADASARSGAAARDESLRAVKLQQQP